MHTASHSRHIIQGILLMLVAMFGFSAMAGLIRALAGELPSLQIVAMRNVFSLSLMSVWLAMEGLHAAKTQRLHGHFWRSAIGICSMQLFFYALTQLPITEVTALSFTAPIFVTVFAILFLGEKAGIRRWVAVIAGFAGTLIILRPGIDAIHPASLIVLGSSMLTATIVIAVKNLTRTEPPERIVFYMALFMTIFSVPTAVPVWQPMNTHQLMLLFGIAASSTISHLCTAHAYRKAEMTLLMPFDFTRLIFTGIFGYFWFGEVLKPHTLFGSALILVSAVYIAHRETWRRNAPGFDGHHKPQ